MGKKNSLQSPQSLPAKVENKYERLRHLHMPFEPMQVQDKALKELDDKKGETSFDAGGESSLAQAMTLKEFDNGLLMSLGLQSIYKTFAIQLSQDLQRDYKCETAGRKSLAEVAALNHVRILDLQRHINGFLIKDAYGDLTAKIIAVLSKELDRAQRQYMTAIQTLEMGVQPPLKVNVRTQVANVANQQAIMEQFGAEKEGDVIKGK